MVTLILFGFFIFSSGALLGKSLAANGINSDNALKKHQRFLSWILIAIAFILGTLIIIDKLNLTSLLPKIFPPLLLIYLGGYFHEFLFGMGCFCLGLLIFLELSGKLSRPKILQLLIAITAISCALSILLFFLQPVYSLIGRSIIIDGVVMQTTEYTCAPSAIATLARYTQKYPQLTEQEAIVFTKTNRFGTTTLLEIKAMQQLELNPEYRHNLSIEDLISLQKPALLHVKEKNKRQQGVRFSHAVALLDFDAKKERFLIGNPYYGLQSKTISDMQDYWFGEAIVVN